MYIKIPVNMNYIYWDFILTTPIIDKLIKINIASLNI